MTWLSIGWYIVGFSLSAFKNNQGIPAADPLPAWAQALLLEELDIAQYMDTAQCRRGAGLYSNTMKSGQDTGFNQNAVSTPQCERLFNHLLKTCMRSYDSVNKFLELFGHFHHDQLFLVGIHVLCAHFMYICNCVWLLQFWEYVEIFQYAS